MENSEAWSVRFANGALDDLAGIVRFLLENEGPDVARELSALIRKEGETRLATLPFRGRIPPELEGISTQYREVRVKSWRLVYRPVPEQRVVRILVIVHGKRNIQDMLLGRILTL